MKERNSIQDVRKNKSIQVFSVAIGDNLNMSDNEKKNNFVLKYTYIEYSMSLENIYTHTYISGVLIILFIYFFLVSFPFVYSVVMF